ncbi:MAG: molybdenum cofactor guanylyltransferase [Thermoleophilaceae bacterium]|jgi:molybdopterin-guanine dinucleotide biosynthesis protein A|nr:molybdenum cofactor guanylyltransferase [Thermoleophilaceae bacterium]
MVGILLAGGAGRRIGGEKAARLLAGRPLASYPAAALRAVCERVAIVAKPGTDLPELEGVERWDGEPAEPRHPLTGIVYALERADEPVLVCAADMPFVTAEALRTLMSAGGDTAIVAVAGGVLQPVLAVYAPSALDALRAAEPDAPLTRTVEALDPVRVALPPPLVRSVDTPEEVAAAEAELGGR